MKKTLFALAIAGTALLAVACGQKSTITMGDKNQLDTLSYAIGIDVGTGFGYSFGDVPLDFDALSKGMNEGAHAKSKIDRDSANVILRSYFMEKRPERARLTAERLAADSTLVAPKPDETLFENEQERYDISYAIGVDMGTNMAENELPIQLIWFKEGMQAAFAGEETKLSADQSREYLQHYFNVVVPAKNKLENEEWMAKMAKKSGVKKTESGLLYKIEKMGDETNMAKDDRDQVKVHYTGWNHKGKVFDSSYFELKSEQAKEMIKMYNPDAYGKDEAVDLPLNGVIKGWSEGLKLVGKGGKITLWIPSDLAYGEQGRSQLIPGNEALKFEITVEDVMPYTEPVVEAAPAEEMPEVVMAE